MNVLLKNWVGLASLKLGLEIIKGMAVGAAVGTTTGIGEVIAIVLGFVTGGTPRLMSSALPAKMLSKGLSLPIALASAFFLHFLWVGIDVPVLGEVTREVLDVIGCAICQTCVVTIVLLVGASHWFD